MSSPGTACAVPVAMPRVNTKVARRRMRAFHVLRDILVPQSKASTHAIVSGRTSANEAPDCTKLPIGPPWLSAFLNVRFSTQNGRWRVAGANDDDSQALFSADRSAS